MERSNVNRTNTSVPMISYVGAKESADEIVERDQVNKLREIISALANALLIIFK